MNRLKVYDLGEIKEVKSFRRGNKCIRRFIADKVTSLKSLSRLIKRKQKQINSRMEKERTLGIKDEGLADFVKDLLELQVIESEIQGVNKCET